MAPPLPPSSNIASAATNRRNETLEFFRLASIAFPPIDVGSKTCITRFVGEPSDSPTLVPQSNKLGKGHCRTGLREVGKRGFLCSSLSYTCGKTPRIGSREHQIVQKKLLAHLSHGFSCGLTTIGLPLILRIQRLSPAERSDHCPANRLNPPAKSPTF